MTIEELYNKVLLQLQKIYDPGEADNITDWVFENITGKQRWQRRNDKNVVLKDQHVSVINACLAQLLQHKPVQYVLHEAWFFKMKFYVNEHVLIPRPETEELVSWIIDDQKIKKNKKPLCLLDIGTGSGCIAIALKKYFDAAHVIAIDISNDALAVAKKNAGDLKTEITFCAIDFLSEKNVLPDYSFDVIVSNPPYIPVQEKDKLAKNVAGWEPYQALFVSNTDPFIFYKRIAAFAQLYLKNDGIIYVEIHEAFAKEAASVFAEHHFTTIIKKDIYAKERMLKACKYK